MLNAEAKVLKEYLNWNLNVITVYHFAQVLMEIGIVFENDTTKNKKIDQALVRGLSKRILFFVDLSTE